MAPVRACGCTSSCARARDVVFEAGQDKLIVLGWVSFASAVASLGAVTVQTLLQTAFEQVLGKGPAVRPAQHTR